MRISDVLFIGIGQCGNAITAKVMEETKRVNGLFINTNKSDLQNIEKYATRENTFIVPAASGTGRNRKKAKEYLIRQRHSILELLEEYPNLENIHIAFSMGGGTGSGMAPALAKMLEIAKPDIKVNMVAVLPKRDDSQQTLFNTLSCWTDISALNNVNNIYLLDNNKRRLVTDVNEEFAKLFNKFLRVPKNQYDQNSVVIDGSEITLLNKANGISAIYELDNNYKDNVTRYVANVMRKSIFVLNSKNCQYFGLVTDEDFEATELYNEFESDLDHWLCKSDTAEPMLMVSGTPIKSCEKTFLDIKSLYEDKTNLTEKSLIEDENDDYIFDVLIEEVQSKKSKKVRKKEKVEDVEDLSDDDWEKLLNM